MWRHPVRLIPNAMTLALGVTAARSHSFGRYELGAPTTSAPPSFFGPALIRQPDARDRPARHVFLLLVADRRREREREVRHEHVVADDHHARREKQAVGRAVLADALELAESCDDPPVPVDPDDLVALVRRHPQNPPFAARE